MNIEEILHQYALFFLPLFVHVSECEIYIKFSLLLKPKEQLLYNSRKQTTFNCVFYVYFVDFYCFFYELVII